MLSPKWHAHLEDLAYVVVIGLIHRNGFYSLTECGRRLVGSRSKVAFLKDIKMGMAL
jgi:hypothetical protein